MKKHKKGVKGSLLATSALTTVSLALAAFGPGPAFAAEEGAGGVAEVVVLGEFIPEVMRETPQVSSVVLPEDLVRAGDTSAAAALVRVTRINIVQGRFVYVRGLGERYSSALLNGSPLPSPEPLQRVVPLDLFPANILAGVTVQKTYSPQYPGEFGGGTIDMQTIGVPDERFLTMSISGGGTVDTTLEPGLTYYGARWDWTGFDDGTRDLPTAVLQADALDRGAINQSNFTDLELQAIGRDFVNAPLNLLQMTDKVPGDWGVDISAGDRFEANGIDLGVVAVASYGNSWETRRGIQEAGEVNLDNEIETQTHYDFVSTQNDVALNGLLGFGVNWENYELRWTNLYVRRVTKEARSREGFDHLAGNEVRDDFTEWFQRELYDTQAVAYGVFGPLELEATGSWAKSLREAPYEKSIRYRLVDDEYIHSTIGDTTNSTRFGEVDDRVWSAGIDATYTMAVSELRDITLSAGYQYFDNARSAEQRSFRFQALNTALPPDVQRQRVDFLFSDFNQGPDGILLTENTDPDSAAYDGVLDVHALYGNIDWEIFPLVRIAAGVRYEESVLGVTLRNIFGGTPPVSPPETEKDYWLPAGALTWNFYEDMQLRLAASQTIARPQFRELAPQPYLDPDTDRFFIGNPYLRDSDLLNLDARYEWYFAQNEYVALSGFFKRIDRPIELIVNEVGGSVQTTFLNAPEATLWGGELEARAYFQLPLGDNWLSDLLWFGAANYTYTRSTVNVDEGDVVFPLTGGGAPSDAEIYVRDGSRLQGQSDHILNLQLGIEDGDGFQATVLMNYTSDRISTRGRPGFPDLMVDPGVQLDFTLRKEWVGMDGVGSEISFEARNILGTDYEEFQERGGTVYNNAYEVGPSFSVSVKRRY